MRCCVPDCKNDSRHSSKSQGITFHTFPTTPAHRTAWLKAINKQDWHPKERSAICSVHFMPDDLYFTKTGLRKVRAGAVPVITQEFSNSYGLGLRLQACRMCLAIDTRLFSMNLYNLEQPFERFTGISPNTEDRLPQHLCYNCAQRLLKADSFRSSSIKANSLLIDLLKENELSKDTIKAIDRDTHNLTTPLSIKHNLPDQYELELEYVEAKQEPLDNLLIEEHTDNTPLENDIFVDEIKDFDNDFHSDEDLDKTYTTKGDDFDSEDSVPLEVTRKKKKKEKAKTKKVRIKPEEPKIDRRRKPFLNQDLNETLFTVTNLTIEEQLAEIEKRQYTDNYKHSLYKCTECFKGFLDQTAYNSHMSRHTDECGEYRCEICKTHFKQSHALRKHITAHHTQRFSCNQCPYVTTHRQTARLHERWHKGTKYSCPHCQEEFVKFTTYMGHVRIKHPSDFVCELCGYSFVSAKGIELHKKLKHRTVNGPVPADGPYCNECDVRFASAEAHRKHLAVSAKHSSKENREANKANKGQRTREIRERISKQESEPDDPRRIYPSQLKKAEGPIPCEQCGIQLEDSRAYHGHFRRMHPDKNRTNYPSMKSPCMCELCGRIFQSYALLKDHTWVHTGERPFKCDQCDKSFRMKQRLVAHRRVHSLVKASYMCAVCGKHFSTHSNRQRHMFIHTGLKPFKCEMCGKGFKHASEKRAHVTYVHLKKPWPKRARGKRLRQDSLPPQGDTSANDMDIQPVWPSCVCVAPN